MFSAFRQDLTHATRSLCRRPVVTTAAVLSLALGIGVNTAIFSVFDRLMLRRLPVPHADQIVLITSPGPRPGSTSTGDSGGREQVFSYPLFRDLERLQTAGLSRIAAHRDFAANLAWGGQTVHTSGLLVSGSYFAVLGISPAVGRLLTPEDDRSLGGQPVVVLGHDYWVRQFGSDAAVVGRPLVVNGEALTIVGVAPPAFAGTTALDRPQVYVPLALIERLHAGVVSRTNHALYLVARLDGQASREQAQLAINQPFTALIRDVEYPAEQTDIAAAARPAFLARRIILQDGSLYRATNRGEMRVALGLLLAVTGLVLLIACANVANLLLARATDRAGEFAIRRSLGASAPGLARLLLLESSILGIAAAVAALGVARLTGVALMRLLPADDAAMMTFETNGTVLAFTMSVGLATGLLFGVVPALHVARARAMTLLSLHGDRASNTRGAARFRTSLATAQIALAIALVAMAALFGTSLVNVSREALGFTREGLITFRVSPNLNGYSTERVSALFDRITDTLRALPGVAGVTASTNPILADANWNQNITIAGVEASPGRDMSVSTARVAENYLRTLGITLLEGREFTPSDASGAPQVAIVNEAFVRKFDLHGSALGRRLALGAGRATPDIEIVGVMRNAKYSKVREPAPAQLLLPYRQGPVFSLTFYVRSTGPDGALLAAVPGVVAGIDRTLPVERLTTMDDQIWDNITPDRVFATLSSWFAGLATLLAGIGLYAVLAYSVAQRLKEIGIRLALGARPADVRLMLFRQVGRMTASGAAIGVVAAAALGRVGQAMLFGLTGTDPVLIGGACAAVALVVLLATALPARRAANADPVAALRAE